MSIKRNGFSLVRYGDNFFLTLVRYGGALGGLNILAAEAKKKWVIYIHLIPSKSPHCLQNICIQIEAKLSRHLLYYEEDIFNAQTQSNEGDTMDDNEAWTPRRF